MTTYTKTNKGTSSYTKIDKTEKGWLLYGYLLYGWLTEDFCTKIDKEISNYTKTNKE